MSSEAHFVSAPSGKHKYHLIQDFRSLGITCYDDRFGSAFATVTLTAEQTRELKNLGYNVRLNCSPYTDL